MQNRELAINEIKEIIKEADITPQELGMVSTEDLLTRVHDMDKRITVAVTNEDNAYRVAGKMFDKLVSELGSERAYQWLNDEVSDDEREALYFSEYIDRPRTYSIATVTLTHTVAVPSTYDEDNIRDYLESFFVSDYSCADVNIEYAGVLDVDMCKFFYDNDERDFVNSDWEE